MSIKKFIYKGVIYSIPLVIIIAIIFIIDPYYLFSKADIINNDKYEIGYSYDQGRRFKIFTYLNQPTEKIILGASEINVLTKETMPGQCWHSLSYGGAPLQESLHMYWVANEVKNIKNVIIAPEFIKYYNAISIDDPYYANFTWEKSQSAIALRMYENKWEYFSDKYTCLSTFDYCMGYLGTNKNQGTPMSSKEEFWNSQLAYAHKVYDNYQISIPKMNEVNEIFRKIQLDAAIRSCNIIVLIPVQHVDLLKVEFNDRVYNTYKSYIKMLVELFGDIYYFAYTDGISEQKEQFSDPFHYLHHKVYTDCLFNDKKGTILNKSNYESKLNEIRNKVIGL